MGVAGYWLPAIGINYGRTFLTAVDGKTTAVVLPRQPATMSTKTRGRSRSTVFLIVAALLFADANAALARVVRIEIVSRVDISGTSARRELAALPASACWLAGTTDHRTRPQRHHHRRSYDDNSTRPLSRQRRWLSGRQSQRSH